MEKITVEAGIEKYSRFIFYRALHFNKFNYHDAEDLASETIMRALMQKNGWRNSILSFISWINGVMMNALKSFQWGTNRTGRVDTVGFEHDEYEELASDGDQELIDVNMLIEKLPYPEIAKLNGMGYTNEEIAAIIGRSRVVVIKRAKRNREFYMENCK